MFDILDVNEVDGCYYGLFRDESEEASSADHELYTIFKTASEGGVV